jgi:hypothetical protein
MSNGTTDNPVTTSTPNPTTNPASTMGTGTETGRESSLSNWAGDYVTNMLGKGQALADAPYQAYTGPLTAGASNLQNEAFSGLAGLTIPTGKMGAYTPGSFTDTGVAQKYMNPYLTQALEPQFVEARRQAEINRINDAGRLTKAGAYGGSRQAIMESEGNRNLTTNLANITGQGYKTAYDLAANQFNTEQGRGQSAQEMNNAYGLNALRNQAELGAVQRGIESEGVAADKAQFEEQRDYPYKQVQYQQSLLQGLPIAAQTYSYAQPSTLSQILNSAGGLQSLYDLLFGGGGGSTPTTTPTKPGP